MENKQKPVRKKKPSAKKQTEKIDPVRTFGYILKNGERGEVQAASVPEAKIAVRQIAESFGIYDKKCFYDFYEVR